MNRFLKPADFEIFEHLPHPVWVFDLDHRCMWWANSHAIKLWNAESLENLLARDFTDTSEATNERLDHYRRQFLKGKTLVEQWTFYPKGKPRVVVCTCSGVWIGDGQVALLIEGRPISKTDIGPDALRCVEALHHTSLMVSIFTLEGKLIFQNPASSRTFPVGTHKFSERFHCGEIADQIWAEVTNGDFVSLEAEFATKAGVRWHGIDCKLTRDPVEGNQVVLCNQRDLHQLKVTELKLEQAMVEANEMALIKSRFLANMSHEIRTPLNGVLGMAQLLEETQLSPTQNQYVKHMQDAAQILRTLIDDILDYSKLEAGRLTLKKAPFSLRKCFQTCISLVEPQAKAKRLRLLATDMVAREIFLHGDEVRLTQILINILGNAIKFTNQGDVRFQIHASSPSAGTCALEFTIADTGIGIAIEDQERLFARFTQLDNSRRRGQSGTGLGLAICRELLDLMQGHIALESSPGQGSRFIISLNLPLVEAAPSRTSSSVAPATTDTGLDILLVEDNFTNQMVAKRMVTKLGHQCRLANNGEEALDQVAIKRPDLILMDVVMPVMDGLTATRKIRAREKGTLRTPIIALTANVMKEERELYNASEMDDFIAKPLDFKTLEDTISKWQQHIS